MPNLSHKELLDLKKNLKEYKIFYSAIAKRSDCTERYVKAVFSTKDSRYSPKVIKNARLMLSDAFDKEFSNAKNRYRKGLTVI